MNQGFSSHRHTAGTEAGQTSAPAEATEREWEYTVNGRYPMQARVGQNLEIVTRLGVRHLGVAVSVSTAPRMDPRIIGPVSAMTLFMSETSEEPEYYQSHQIEKWRLTDTVVKKKRLISVSPPDNDYNTGTLSPLFASYFVLRYLDKKEGRGREHYQVSTYHYTDVAGKHQWETIIGMRDFDNVHLVEVDGDGKILIHTNGKNEKFEKLFDFKHVAQAVEEVLWFLENNPA